MAGWPRDRRDHRGSRARPRDRSRPPLLAVRIAAMEVRHSAFVWAIPLLAVLFIYDPFRTAAHYPALWTLRASVVLDKFWPLCVPFAAGFSAWAGSREGRRNIDDLLGATARPAWTRQLCSLAATLAWVLAVFLAGVVVLYVQHRAGGDLGRAADLAGRGRRRVADRGLRARVHPGGAVPRPVHRPDRRGGHLGARPGRVQPDGQRGRHLGLRALAGRPVPGNDAGVFYPVAPDVSIVAGHVLRRVRARGGRPARAVPAHRRRRVARRTRSWRAGEGRGCAPPRPPSSRPASPSAVTGFGLAATARTSPVTGGIEVPALHDSASDQPIPYTPVCADASGGFRVCLHPAFKGYLSQAVNSLGPVIAELSGLPGTPVRAVEIPGLALPPIVQAGRRRRRS